MRLKSAGGISLLSLSSLPSASVARLSVLLCNSVIGYSFQPCSYRKGYQSGAQRLPFLGRRLEQPLGVGGYALLANAIYVYRPSKLDRTQPCFCPFWPMHCLLVTFLCCLRRCCLTYLLQNNRRAQHSRQLSTASDIKMTQPLTVVAMG